MRGTLTATAVFVAAVLLSACGSESHPNDPRPPLTSVISVSLAEDSISVSPKITGIPGKRPVNISQNLNAPVNQGNRKAKAVVQMVISNLTPRATRVFVQGPVDATAAVTASGPVSFQRALPNGIYRISSPASTATARFAIGPSRVSSSSDLLSP